MSPEQERMFLFIKKHPGATYHDLIKFTGSARASVWNMTRRLINAELINEVVPSPEARFYPGRKK